MRTLDCDAATEWDRRRQVRNPGYLRAL